MRTQRYPMLFILGVILVFFGCATCPSQDTIDMLWTPIGPIIIETEKDSYNEERHSEELFLKGEGWITRQEYEALVKEYQEKPIETPNISVKERMEFISNTLQETSDVVDILSDDTLSVEERMRLYESRMKEINERLGQWNHE